MNFNFWKKKKKPLTLEEVMDNVARNHVLKNEDMVTFSSLEKAFIFETNNPDGYIIKSTDGATWTTVASDEAAGNNIQITTNLSLEDKYELGFDFIKELEKL